MHIVHKTTAFTSQLLILGILALSACSPAKKGSLTSHQTVQINQEIVPSATVADYIQPYTDSLEMAMGETIGEAAQRMTVKMPESLLSNFVADLLLEETNLLCQSDENLPLADFSVINYKGLRTSIEAGPITVGRVFELMPFENEVVLVKLTKSEVIELFDFMASTGGDGIGGAGFGISQEKAVNLQVNKAPLSDKEYYIATSDYLANGGDYFTVFKKAPQLKTGLLLRDVILEHIEKKTRNGKQLNSQLDKRIYHVQ